MNFNNEAHPTGRTTDVTCDSAPKERRSRKRCHWSLSRRDGRSFSFSAFPGVLTWHKTRGGEKKKKCPHVSCSVLLVHILVVGDVLNDLGGREQLLRVVVGDLEAELVLHGHDDLHVVEGVQAEVFDEVGLEGQLERR